MIGTRTMPPQGTNLVLSSDIPHGERDVLVLNGLNIEACPEMSGAETLSWRDGGTYQLLGWW